MSFQDGWAAINLDMPKRVPRTEYSADFHWDLIEAVTGMRVDWNSPADELSKAQNAFYKAWQYDFMFDTPVSTQIFGDLQTSMGHAEYQKDGVDFNTNIGSPFKSFEDVLNFDPWERLGQRDKKEIVTNLEGLYNNKCKAMPDMVHMTGIYVTMVSGMLGMFGWDLLLEAAGEDSEAFGAFANRYSSWIQQYFDAVAETDVPVVMIHDDMVWTEGAIFRPEWYRKFVFPNFKKQFAPIVESGKKLIFCSDGTYNEFIDDLVDCGAQGFVMEPTVDMAYIAEKYGKTHVFIGNADTRILLFGTKPQIRAEVERCMAIGKNCPGFFMAVGNHIPPNTPVENCLYYNKVYEELSVRD